MTKLESTATTAEIRAALEALEPGGPALELEPIAPGEPAWSARRLEAETWRLEEAPDEDGETGRPLDGDLEATLEAAGGEPGGADDRPDPDKQEAWEAGIRAELERRGHDPAELETRLEGFGCLFPDWHAASASEAATALLEEAEPQA